MKSFFGNNLGSKLALAALAVCFFAVPGKAQDTHKSRPELLVCTSYPEWSCEPQTMPSQKVASATTPQMDGPSCTSYPEWSCEPQTVSGQERALAKERHEKKGSKLHAGQRGQERKSSQKVSDAPGGLDESFERRP